MSTLTLHQVGPLAFEVKTDHWSLRIDLPIEKGGTQTGPTPTELTAIALAACKAMTVAKWAQNKSIKMEGISAEVTYELADAPRRITEMDVVLKNVRQHVPPEMYPRLEAAIGGCTVSTTLKHGTTVTERIE